MAGKVMLQTCVRIFFGRDCFGGAAFFLVAKAWNPFSLVFFHQELQVTSNGGTEPDKAILGVGFPLALHAACIGVRIPPSSVPEMFGEL